MDHETPNDRFRLSDDEKDRRLAALRAKLQGQSESERENGQAAGRPRSAGLMVVAVASAAIVVGLIWAIARYA
jgi:hypothetical protein